MTPRNLEAEQSVIGAVLFDNRNVERVSLEPRHFSEPLHAELWAKLCEMHRQGRIADCLTLKDWANGHPGVKEVGGAVYLLKLFEAAPPVQKQLTGYAELLRDQARRRELIEAARGAAARAEIMTGEEDAADIQADLERRLQDIANADGHGDDWERIGAVAMEAVERAELGEAKGISTGLERLDAVTGGMQPGTLWVIGGATSMGKSIVGAGLSRSIASQGYGVGEFHLEMDKAQIGLRAGTAMAFDSAHTAENPFYLSAQRNRLRPEQWETLRGATKALARLPIYVDARAGRTLSQIEASARRLFRQMQREGMAPGALLIDHEGLIAPEPGARFPSQLERTNARSEGLLAMAKRLGVCVVALSQITKEGARADGEDRLPNLTDLNYGGAISQAASVVILIHRKAYHAERIHPDDRTPEQWAKTKSREATLIVDKARGGQRDHVKILMDVPTAAIWGAD